MVYTVFSANAPVTIPKAVRKTLRMKCGDLVSWELESDSVRLRVLPAMDHDDLKGVEAGLTEWGTEADEEAFSDF